MADKDFWQKIFKQIKEKKLLAMGLVGIMLIFLVDWQGMLGGHNNFIPQEQSSAPPSRVELPAKDEEERNLERDLEAILSQVEGVGEIKVKVNLESGKQYQYAYNESKEKNIVEEKDQQGGTRITTNLKDSQEIVTIQENGGQKPVVLKELRPPVKGVMVVAQGAEDSLVKANLIEAVQTVLEIPAYKVMVLPRKG